MKQIKAGIKALSIPEGLKKQLYVLIDHYPEYVNMGQGPTWRSVIVAMCNAYGTQHRDAVAKVITASGSGITTSGMVTTTKKVAQPMKVYEPSKKKKQNADGCNGCTQSENTGGVKLSTAKSKEDVYNWFKTGVSEEVAIKSMLAWMNTNGVRPASNKKKDGAYLANKIYTAMQEFKKQAAAESETAGHVNPGTQ